MFTQRISFIKIVQIGDHHIQYRHNIVVGNSGALYQVHHASHEPHQILQISWREVLLDRELVSRTRGYWYAPRRRNQKASDQGSGLAMLYHTWNACLGILTPYTDVVPFHEYCHTNTAVTFSVHYRYSTAMQTTPLFQIARMTSHVNSKIIHGMTTDWMSSSFYCVSNPVSHFNVSLHSQCISWHSQTCTVSGLRPRP